jgi:hypothetical protein
MHTCVIITYVRTNVLAYLHHDIMSVSKPAHIMRELLRNYKTTRKLPKNLERCLVIVGFLLGVLLVFKFISSKSGKGGTAFRRRDKIAIVVLTSYRIDHTKRVIDGIRHMDPKADYTIAYRDSNAPDILKKITRERFDYVRDVPAFLHKNQRGNDYYRPTQSPLRTTWLYVMTDLWSRFLDLNEVCYFEDDIFPHPQFLKILREVRQTARGRLETSAQNEKKRQTCQTCLTGDLKDGGVALENGMCRDYCSRNGFCGSNANYRNRGTDCTFLKTNTVPRVWSFKGRVGQGLTSVNALRESMNADYSMAVPLCITFQEYSLFIQNVADDYCLQSGGGMNAYVLSFFFFFSIFSVLQRNQTTHQSHVQLGYCFDDCTATGLVATEALYNERSCGNSSKGT